MTWQSVCAITSLGSTTQGNQPETLRRGSKGAQTKGNQDATQGNHMKTLRRGQRIKPYSPLQGRFMQISM